MTRNESIRRDRLYSSLASLGFTAPEIDKMRRISLTLQAWFEKECGDGHGAIVRDESTGKTYYHLSGKDVRWPVADRETGAYKRLAAIMARANTYRAANELKPLTYYIQGDCRGASLYILRPSDVPEGKEPESYYSRGICVY